MTGGKFQSYVNKSQGSAEGGATMSGAPLGGTRAEAAQRLQVGVFGLASMVLLIGLATVIGNQADLTQERAVPEAAPTTEPTDTSTQRDPLADAGIVPDLPSEPQSVAPESAVEGLLLEDVVPEEDQMPADSARQPQ